MAEWIARRPGRVGAAITLLALIGLSSLKLR